MISGFSYRDPLALEVGNEFENGIELGCIKSDEDLAELGAKVQTHSGGELG